MLVTVLRICRVFCVPTDEQHESVPACIILLLALKPGHSRPLLQIPLSRSLVRSSKYVNYDDHKYFQRHIQSASHQTPQNFKSEYEYATHVLLVWPTQWQAVGWQNHSSSENMEPNIRSRRCGKPGRISMIDWVVEHSVRLVQRKHYSLIRNFSQLT